MKTTFSLSVLLSLLLIVANNGNAQTSPKQPADYVNPFLGTDFFGHTFPGPCLPYGLVHVGPDTGTQGWSHCAG
jgi:putative alpha-1,2-mannosidase